MEQVIQWETFYETCHNSERQLKQAKIEADRVKVEIENVFTQQSESCTSSDEESDADDFNDEFFTLCVGFFLLYKFYNLTLVFLHRKQK